jgi:hypothetical protein
VPKTQNVAPSCTTLPSWASSAGGGPRPAGSDRPIVDAVDAVEHPAASTIITAATKAHRTAHDSVQVVGFLDRAKKLAEQAKSVAEQAKEVAEGALSEAKAKAQSASGGDGGRSSSSSAAPATDPRMGTSYVPGMLGRPGWREQGLIDPAALLPIDERDRAGVPHSTKSEIVEEPFGMGRRWRAGGRAVGLFYRLYPEHRSWEPPGGRTPVPDMQGVWQASLPDGSALVFLAGAGAEVVLETDGLEDTTRSDLALVVARQLAG